MSPRELSPFGRRDVLRPGQRSDDFTVENPMRGTSLNQLLAGEGSASMALNILLGHDTPPDVFVRSPQKNRDAQPEEGSVWTVQLNGPRTRIPVDTGSARQAAAQRPPMPLDGEGAKAMSVRHSRDRNTDALLPPRSAAHVSTSNGGRPWSSGRAQASALSARRGPSPRDFPGERPRAAPPGAQRPSRVANSPIPYLPQRAAQQQARSAASLPMGAVSLPANDTASGRASQSPRPMVADSARGAEFDGAEGEEGAGGDRVGAAAEAAARALLHGTEPRGGRAPASQLPTPRGISRKTSDVKPWTRPPSGSVPASKDSKDPAVSGTDAGQGAGNAAGTAARASSASARATDAAQGAGIASGNAARAANGGARATSAHKQDAAFASSSKAVKVPRAGSGGANSGGSVSQSAAPAPSLGAKSGGRSSGTTSPLVAVRAGPAAAHKAAAAASQSPAAAERMAEEPTPAASAGVCRCACACLRGRLRCIGVSWRW